MNTAFVSYIRVSTTEQGASGLGLEAQKNAVDAYCKDKGNIIAEFVEIESAKNDKRVELQKAISRCQTTNAILVIAKLDRLSRNAVFLLKLQESKVKFVCVDMPNADNFTIGIMAMLAQHEREAISGRTRAALAVIKAWPSDRPRLNRKGVLARPMGRQPGLPSTMTVETRSAGQEANKSKAIAHAASLKPYLQQWIAEGKSLPQIVDELNNGKFTTSSGVAGRWQMVQVQRIFARLNI